MEYTISDLLKVVTHDKRPPRCDDTMQLTVQKAEGGVAKGIWEISEKFINGNNVVMGGFISSAADIMMAYAIASVLTNDEKFASIDLDTTFHRPAFEGEAEITATVARKGRLVAYLTAEVTQSDKVISNCVSSVMIIPSNE